MLAGDAVVASQMPLGLVPEVLDAINVVEVVREQLGVVDADMVELRDVQHVVGSEAIGVDDRLRPDLFANDRKKRSGRGIWDDDDMHLAAPFQQSEHRHFAPGATSTLALAMAAEIALVNLDLSAHQARVAGGQLLEDHLA